MSMTHRSIHHMFSEVKFHKSGKVIREKAGEKIKALEAKIGERKARIARIRKDYDITDADMIELLSAKARNQLAEGGTYTLSNKIVRGEDKPMEVTIAAGIINNIDTENALMTQEKDHVERLGLIERNIDADVKHEIGFDELDYLGL